MVVGRMKKTSTHLQLQQGAGVAEGRKQSRKQGREQEEEMLLLLLRQVATTWGVEGEEAISVERWRQMPTRKLGS